MDNLSKSANFEVTMFELGLIRFTKSSALIETKGLDNMLMPGKVAKFVFESLP